MWVSPTKEVSEDREQLVLAEAGVLTLLLRRAALLTLVLTTLALLLLVRLLGVGVVLVLRVVARARLLRAAALTLLVLLRVLLVLRLIRFVHFCKVPVVVSTLCRHLSINKKWPNGHRFVNRKGTKRPYTMLYYLSINSLGFNPKPGLLGHQKVCENSHFHDIIKARLHHRNAAHLYGRRSLGNQNYEFYFAHSLDHGYQLSRRSKFQNLPR